MVQTGDGIAIVDNGLSLGGGYLQQFGINSNTSANGFIKCLYKKKVSNRPNKKPCKVIAQQPSEPSKDGKGG